MGENEDFLIPLENPADGTVRRRKTKQNDNCKGCFYYGGKAESVKCCNYYLITGRRRPCEMGEDCIVRMESSEVRRKSVKIKNNR